MCRLDMYERWVCTHATFCNRIVYPVLFLIFRWTTRSIECIPCQFHMWNSLDFSHPVVGRLRYQVLQKGGMCCRVEAVIRVFNLQDWRLVILCPPIPQVASCVSWRKGNCLQRLAIVINNQTCVCACVDMYKIGHDSCWLGYFNQ